MCSYYYGSMDISFVSPSYPSHKSLNIHYKMHQNALVQEHKSTRTQFQAAFPLRGLFSLQAFFIHFLLGKRSFILSQEISHQDLITAAMNEEHKQKTDGNYPISCSNINSKNESWRECFNKEKKNKPRLFSWQKEYTLICKLNLMLNSIN